MKPTFIAIIFALCTLAASAQTPAAIPTDANNAKKARAVLDQAIQALGGQAYLNIQDMRQEGRTYGFYHGVPNGEGALFWRFWKYPDKDRVELTKQRDWIVIHNGDVGLETTYRGTRAEDPADLAQFLHRRMFSLEFVLRRWINQPGVALFYDGTTLAERKQVEQVTIMNAKNEAVTLFIDTHTHLPVKKTYTVRDPASREHDEEGEVYDNYRPEQGINTPHSVARSHNGELVSERFIRTVTYNSGLADSLFTANINYDPNKTPPRKK